MKTDQPGVELPLPEGLLEHAQSVWIESCKHIRVSGLHRDVARVLTLMGLAHTIEQLTQDSLFSVDIALAGKMPHISFMILKKLTDWLEFCLVSASRRHIKQSMPARTLLDLDTCSQSFIMQLATIPCT